MPLRGQQRGLLRQPHLRAQPLSVGLVRLRPPPGPGTKTMRQGTEGDPLSVGGRPGFMIGGSKRVDTHKHEAEQHAVDTQLDAFHPAHSTFKLTEMQTAGLHGFGDGVETT